MKEDYKAERNLKKLSDDIPHQTFWGLIPELPAWDFEELGAYLPASNLPALLNNLSVKNGIMGFSVTSFQQFTKHTEIYEINATPEAFTAKLQKIIDSQTEKEFCQNLLDLLRTNVYFVVEWDD